MPGKGSPSTNICLEAENDLTFDLYTISEVFKKLFSYLTKDLVQKHTAATNTFDNKCLEIIKCLTYSQKKKLFKQFKADIPQIFKETLTQTKLPELMTYLVDF